MEVILKGKVMEVISKEYDFNGTKGISHKVCIYSDANVYQVVIPENQVSIFNDIIGDYAELRCHIYVKGSYNLRIK